MAEYHIERLNDENADKWDEFNNNSREGSIFHTLKWKELADRRGDVEAQYTLLFKDDSVCGIFPFVKQNIRFFKGLVPAYHICPVLQDYTDTHAIQYILRELRKKNRSSFIRFSTMHKEIIENTSNYPGFPSEVHGDTILSLEEFPPEKIWNNFSAKKGQRKFIRRFDDDGFNVVEVKSEEELRLFYQYYKKNINHIGGFLAPYPFIHDLWDNLSEDEIRITLLSRDATNAGGILMFPFKPLNTVFLTYLSINRDLPNTYHPTYYLYWEAINWAWKNEYRRVSFGPGPFDENNPGFRIKKEFGGKYEPLYTRTISLSNLFNAAVTVNNMVRR